MTWYRVNVPFDVQAPDGLSEEAIRNTICDLISHAAMSLPKGWGECSALTMDANGAAKLAKKKRDGEVMSIPQIHYEEPTTAWTADVPAGWQNGDQLLLVAIVDLEGAIFIPQGWILRTSFVLAGMLLIKAFTRVASSEPTSYTLSGNRLYDARIVRL